MKLVEEGNIVGQMGHEESPDLRDVHVPWDQAMASQNPLRIGVADEDGFPTGIQKNAVGRFRSDASDAEEFFPQDGQFLGAHPLDASGIFFPEKPDERLEPLRLDMIITGRSDDLGQAVFIDPQQSVGREKIFVL